MAWLYLLLAGLLEIVWTMALKYSDGFARITPVVIILVCAPVSLYWLSVAMKSIPPWHILRNLDWYRFYRRSGGRSNVF